MSEHDQIKPQIEYCSKCLKVKRITGGYQGPLTNGLTYASLWCSCRKSTEKHDGKLDERDQVDGFHAYAETQENYVYGNLVIVCGGYGDFNNRGAFLDIKQALSLLAWLKQEEETLRALAKEQEQ